MSLFTDSFNRANGAPGNGWTDQVGGVWSILSNQLKAAPTDQAGGNPVTVDPLTQPTDTNGRDVQITYTIPVNSFSGAGLSADGVFRYQSSSGNLYFVDLNYNGGATDVFLLEKCVASAATIFTYNTITINTTHAYRVTAVVFGINPTYLCAKLEDVTANTTVTTLYAVIDSAASLQANGPYGLGATRQASVQTDLFSSITVDALRLSATLNTLSWPAVLGATSYTLYRSTTSGSGYSAIYTGTNLSFVDTPAPCTTYYYVLTVTGAGDGASVTSGYSNEVSLTMGCTGGGGATNCQGQSTITWTAYTGATAYTLYRSATSGSGYVAVYTGAATSYADTPPAGGIYYYVVTVTTASGTSGYSNEITVTAKLSVPSIFNGATTNVYPGTNLAAGRYRVNYLAGAYRINVNSPNWGVQYDDNDAQIGTAHGFYVTDGAGNVVFGPGNTRGYRNQALAEAGNSGQYVYYDHVGGNPIGLYLYDGAYGDNVAGSPNPTFALCGPLVATLAASSTSIDVGDSATLTWASTNADTASDPVGGATLSGSQAVSPTTTTTYTFTATGFSGTIVKTATVTVTVNQPTAPPSVGGVGACGGTVALSWAGATHVTSYILERSADGVSGWSQIYAGGTASYTDTPPSAGVTYYYRVKSVKGSATSAASAVFTGASILAAPTPTGLAVTAHGNRNVVTWTVPSGAYGTLTTSLYRGTTAGGESATAIATGQTSGSYNDTGLENGVAYYYTVKHVNDCGTSGASAEASGTPPCCANEFTAGSTPSTSYTSASSLPSSSSFGSTPATTFTSASPVSTTFTDGTTPSTTFTEGGCPS